MADTAISAPAAATPEANQAPVDNIPKGEKVYVVKHPDGREEKWWGDKVQERLQKSVGLEKRVTDAAKYEQAFNTFVSKVSDPQQLLELLNHPDLKYDEDKQASLITASLGSKKPKVIEAVKKWLYENEVEPSMLKESDPKEYERREWQRKAQALEEEKSTAEKRRKEQEEIQQVAEAKALFQKQLGEAYKASGLPTDDFLVRQVMEKARLYNRAGKQPDWVNCCKLVQADFVNQVKSVLGSATVENILGLMDGETPQKINKALMKALEKKDVVPPTTNVPRGTKRRDKEKSPAEKKQWLRDLGRGIVD